ncbi:MAG: hypothetical protein H7Y43_05355, partial [Akkermansiaceae bacterium]|nr:hypothetical protein [Verrucomicrobiales bacterium]
MKTFPPAAFALLLASLNLTFAQPDGLGIFSRHADIGAVGQAGAVRFNVALNDYAVSGGGVNMWFTNDAFHYVWKEVRGDLTLAANIQWNTNGGDPHRKAGLIFRQSLTPGSAYVDAVLHGDGLTSLQYRETENGQTHEIQSNVSSPARLRLEKRGHYVSLSVAATGDKLHPAGGTVRLNFKEPFYVGLGVCAHDNSRIETATFSKVELVPLPPIMTNAKPALLSTLEVIAIASTDRRVIH